METGVMPDISAICVCQMFPPFAFAICVYQMFLLKAFAIVCPAVFAKRFHILTTVHQHALSFTTPLFQGAKLAKIIHSTSPAL